jgi:hypothetical protein
MRVEPVRRLKARSSRLSDSELCLTSASENDDNAGTNLGFTSFTFVDAAGLPQDVPLDFGSRIANIGHDRLIRAEWYLRIYNVRAMGLFNAFFWDSVS